MYVEARCSDLGHTHPDQTLASSPNAHLADLERFECYVGTQGVLDF